MAQRMIAAGLGRDTAADFLDRQYASVKAWRDAQNAPPIVFEQTSFGPFDDLIEHYASMHAVEAALYGPSFRLNPHSTQRRDRMLERSA